MEYRYLLSRPDEALRATLSAQRVAERMVIYLRLRRQRASILAFNAARIKRGWESERRRPRSTQHYWIPTVVLDARMRLGRIVPDEGRVADAESVLKEALVHDKKLPDAWIMLGNLRSAKGEHLPARDLYSKVVNIVGLKHDTHSRLRWRTLYLV